MGEIFGSADLINELPATGRVIGESASAASSIFLNGWQGHMIAVDEELMLRVWRWLLTDRDAVVEMLKDRYLEELHDSLNAPHSLPADLNSAFLAKLLIESSDLNGVLPFNVNPSGSGFEPVRVFGSVSSSRKTAEGWTLGIKNPNGNRVLARFRNTSTIGGLRGLTRQSVMILGFPDSEKESSLVGIALVICQA